MEIATFTEISKDFPSAMDRVVDDCTPIAITQLRGKPVVMLSLEDWNFIQSKIGGELTHIGD
jgi:PHD/YefM family antitoxin component YafN of YafNO toxin-antitoxin module